MRVVQINTFSYKATGKIMMNIHQLLTEVGHDSYVVWSRGRKAENDHEIVMSGNFGVKFHGVYTRLTDKTGFASKSATRKLIKRFERIKPDIIHLHNIHGYYINLPILFNYIKENDIKIVWTLHDCWPFTGHCAFFDMCSCEKWKSGCNNCEQKKTYPASMLFDRSSWNWEKKKELFCDLDIILVTPCNWLKRLVSQSFLKQYPTFVIYNGIDRNVYKPTVDKDIFQKYRLDKRPIILGVASEWTERKGLKDFVALSKEMIEYQFVVVGLTAEQKRRLPSSIKGIVRTENVQELVALYSVASIFFNPTYEDNFPTTNIEALACGTPVLTYDTGGSPEAVISVDAGRVIKKRNSMKADLKIVKEEIENMIVKFYPDKAIGGGYNVTVSEVNAASDGDGYICAQCRKVSGQFDKDQRLREYIQLYEFIMG